MSLREPDINDTISGTEEHVESLVIHKGTTVYPLSARTEAAIARRASIKSPGRTASIKSDEPPPLTIEDLYYETKQKSDASGLQLGLIESALEGTSSDVTTNLWTAAKKAKEALAELEASVKKLDTYVFKEMAAGERVWKQKLLATEDALHEQSQRLDTAIAKIPSDTPQPPSAAADPMPNGYHAPRTLSVSYNVEDSDDEVIPYGDAACLDRKAAAASTDFIAAALPSKPLEDFLITAKNQYVETEKAVSDFEGAIEGCVSSTLKAIVEAAANKADGSMTQLKKECNDLYQAIVASNLSGPESHLWHLHWEELHLRIKSLDQSLKELFTESEIDPHSL